MPDGPYSRAAIWADLVKLKMILNLSDRKKKIFFQDIIVLDKSHLHNFSFFISINRIYLSDYMCFLNGCSHQPRVFVEE